MKNIPDGSGAWYENKQLEQYNDKCSNDDSLVLYLSKQLYIIGIMINKRRMDYGNYSFTKYR